MKFRIGIGFDLHRLGPSTTLVLGGVEIPHEKGLIGHSDGDVLSHAITDALLGACGLGNIGEMFPDTDDRFKGVSSLKFLRKTADYIRKKGYEIGNIVATKRRAEAAAACTISVTAEANPRGRPRSPR